MRLRFHDLASAAAVRLNALAIAPCQWSLRPLHRPLTPAACQGMSTGLQNLTDMGLNLDLLTDCEVVITLGK